MKEKNPFVSVVDSLLSCLEEILELISFTCLLCITVFPSSIKISSHNSFSEGEDEKIQMRLSQILEHGFTTT